MFALSLETLLFN